MNVIDMQYPLDGEEDYTYRPIEYVTVQRSELAALRDSLAALETALVEAQRIEAERDKLRRVLSDLEEPLRLLGYAPEVQP